MHYKTSWKNFHVHIWQRLWRLTWDHHNRWRYFCWIFQLGKLNCYINHICLMFYNYWLLQRHSFSRCLDLVNKFCSFKNNEMPSTVKDKHNLSFKYSGKTCYSFYILFSSLLQMCLKELVQASLQFYKLSKVRNESFRGQ